MESRIVMVIVGVGVEVECDCVDSYFVATPIPTKFNNTLSTASQNKEITQYLSQNILFFKKPS